MRGSRAGVLFPDGLSIGAVEVRMGISSRQTVSSSEPLNPFSHEDKDKSLRNKP